MTPNLTGGVRVQGESFLSLDASYLTLLNFSNFFQYRASKVESFQRNKGKKIKKFSFTLKDVALLSGLSYATTRKYAAQGKFNPESFESVVEFVVERLGLK